MNGHAVEGGFGARSVKISDVFAPHACPSCLLVRLEGRGSFRQLLVEGVDHFGCGAALHLAEAAGSKLEQSINFRCVSVDWLDLLGEIFAKAHRVGQNHPANDCIRCCS